MVNWNTRDLTLACLTSLYENTTQTRFEVILVDNGSADGSADAIAQHFPKVRLLREHDNHGFAKANNIAAQVADGDYLLLLNTDTVVQPGAIDALFGFAERNPAAGIWGCRTVFGDGTLNPSSAWGKITPWSAVTFASGLKKTFAKTAFFNPEGIGGWLRDSERQVDIVSGCVFLIKRAFWNQLGGFDLTFFMYGEEADLCARARDVGAKPMITPTAQFVHYGGGSAIRAADQMVYIHAARISLIGRQLRGFGQLLARAATIAGVAYRAFAYRIAAKTLPNARLKDRAAEWGNAWARRPEWINGFPTKSV